MASLLWASATRRLASATRRTRSSEIPAAGVPEPEAGVAGVGPLEILGDGDALYTTFDGTEAGTIGTLGTGAARLTGRPAVAFANAGFFFIIAACLAAISARFCAMSSTAESCTRLSI